MNNRFLFFMPLIVAFAFISCESELATSPFDSIDADAAYQTVADLDAGALGAYGGISGQNIYEINALMTDNLRRASSNTGQGMQLFNHNLVAGDNTAAFVWQNAYITIDRINRVLQAIETVEPQTANETTLRNRIQGEMLALRAYQHFDLFLLQQNDVDQCLLGERAQRLTGELLFALLIF